MKKETKMVRYKYQKGEPGFALLRALQPGFMDHFNSVPVNPAALYDNRQEYRIIGDVVAKILTARHTNYSEKEISFLLLLSWYCKSQEEMTMEAAAGAA